MLTHQIRRNLATRPYSTTAMAQKIVIIGSGFSGLYSALAARRLIEENKDRVGNGIDVVMVAPEPKLVTRPRLYEANAAGMSAPLSELLNATGVGFVRGVVDVIRTKDKQVEVVNPTGERSSISYDRLVLAAGSRVVKPNLPGLRKHAFSIDTITDAAELEAHLGRLAALPSSPERNTVVVCGGGFTGIELATELPRRLRAILGMAEKVRVVVVEKADVIGPDLGENPRPVIAQAFGDLEVETKLGNAVASIDARGVVTASGERIDALTVVWTAGVEATPLTRQIPGDKDRQGRLLVDSDLRVPSSPDVFATGDAASAQTDDKGNRTLMSCQHAIPLGRSAGHNVAADLLKIQGQPYLQPSYGTCLDLGGWGAVVCDGWDRKIFKSGGPAKEIKNWINSCVIYPPKANAKEAFEAANPMVNQISVL
ncbi:hypothetical protein THAR02_09245 [Trichoderma harzianum]|uniref:FAD/NAD(P)-binding domain-containing protein n=1 Tax=Trichoderma harzianum TaxID=5544 RepID=A0A0F9X058_TRIHA|nr:hypothetical protein THAR02_09245 [Trichoderma harzianum]